VTLAQQPTTVKPLGVRGAGQAGCVAAPQTIINAILDALASLGIDHIDMPATPSARSARSPARGRSNLLGPVAVGVGDYLHQVTVGVVEIDAATTVEMIDLAGLGAPRIGVIPDALSADAGERRVELGVADKEGVMPRPELFARIEITSESLRQVEAIGSTRPKADPQNCYGRARPLGRSARCRTARTACGSQLVSLAANRRPDRKSSRSSGFR
jgi:hypothetical protein